MLKVEHLEVSGFRASIRGMRHPMNSHHLSDSKFENWEYRVGEKDLELMKRLYKAGNDHAKYLRQINVSMDITAPLFWWKEFDTYKVGTVANSTSTMHKIMSKPFSVSDFSYDNKLDYYVNFEAMEWGEVEDVDEYIGSMILNDVERCNKLRDLYMDKNSKCYKSKYIWRLLIQTLPSAYNQTRTITMNYQVAMNMYHSRKNHKLTEWHTLCDKFMKMPYFKELIESK